MSSTYAASFDRLEECLDEIGAVDPTYRTVAEKQEALVGLSRVIARAEAERLRVLAVADDIAEATGDRSTAAWLATADPRCPRQHPQERASSPPRWRPGGPRSQTAFRAGAVNLAQVRVIDKALTDLPQDLGEDLTAKAEAFLVDKAAQHGPRDLAVIWVAGCWPTSPPRPPMSTSTSGCWRPRTAPRPPPG